MTRGSDFATNFQLRTDRAGHFSMGVNLQCYIGINHSNVSRGLACQNFEQDGFLMHRLSIYRLSKCKIFLRLLSIAL